MDVDRLTDWLICLRTPIVRAYAVRHDDGVSLIDTNLAGTGNALLAALAAELGAPTRVHSILVTHAHGDHYGSASDLVSATGARLLAPSVGVDIMEGRATPEPPQLLDWERPLFEQVMPNVPPAPPVRVDQTLSPGDELDWGRRLQLIAAPGHTRDQLAVWFLDDRVLLAADAIASHDGVPMAGVFNVDPARAATTCQELTALDPDIACFGHGDPLIGKAGAKLREVFADTR